MSTEKNKTTKSNPIQHLVSVPDNYFSMSDAEKRAWAESFLETLYSKIQFVSGERPKEG